MIEGIALTPSQFNIAEAYLMGWWEAVEKPTMFTIVEAWKRATIFASRHPFTTPPVIELEGDEQEPTTADVAPDLRCIHDGSEFSADLADWDFPE